MQRKKIVQASTLKQREHSRTSVPLTHPWGPRSVSSVLLFLPSWQCGTRSEGCTGCKHWGFCVAESTWCSMVRGLWSGTGTGRSLRSMCLPSLRLEPDRSLSATLFPSCDKSMSGWSTLCFCSCRAGEDYWVCLKTEKVLDTACYVILTTSFKLVISVMSRFMWVCPCFNWRIWNTNLAFFGSGC